MDKSKCYDIFQRTKVNNYQMYPVKKSVDFTRFANEIKKKQKMLQKIQVVKGIASRAFCGYGNVTYHRMTLREI